MISAEFLLFGTIDFKLPPASSAHIKCVVRILCVMCVVRIMCAMCFVSMCNKLMYFVSPTSHIKCVVRIMCAMCFVSIIRRV